MLRINLLDSEQYTTPGNKRVYRFDHRFVMIVPMPTGFAKIAVYHGSRPWYMLEKVQTVLHYKEN